tara:strand:+ start:487 stop:828 length:342 start_codon:yes stop_codon:yes gene_type:complete
MLKKKLLLLLLPLSSTLMAGGLMDLPEEDRESIDSLVSFAQCTRVFTENKEYSAATMLERMFEYQFKQVSKKFDLEELKPLIAEQKDRLHDMGYNEDKIAMYCYRRAEDLGVL